MKKNWQGTVIVVLSFVLLIMVSFLGYIVYERNGGTLANWKNHRDNSTKEQVLNIHSRLAIHLYNKVKSHQESCISTWIFGEKEFDVDTSPEDLKMRVVSNNLSEGARIRINCSNPMASKIPAKIGNNMSACETTKTYGQTFDEYGYKREYIEGLYKELFGDSKKLDTSVNIPIVASTIGSLIYVKDLDMYVLYPVITGYTCPVSDSFELVEAKQIGNDIKLYEKYIHKQLLQNNTVLETEANYVYTFRLANDGVYSFISRKKVG